MDVRRLRYFVAVADAANFRQAAERLRVAQPALSRHVAELEKELGFQLFERLPRGIRLSDPGREFLRESRRVLAEFDGMREAADRIAHGAVGTLRIGFTEIVAWSRPIVALFQRFRARHPHVALKLMPLASGSQIADLAGGNIDLALGYMMSRRNGLERVEIATHRLALIMPRHHPLATKRTISVRDLADETFAWAPRSVNPPLYDHMVSVCARAGVSLRLEHEITSVQTLISFAALGVSLSFLNDALPREARHSIGMRHVEELMMPMPLEFVWRQNDPSPALRRFTEMAGAAFHRK